MIIIKISGGLGNQLFQYAFGRYLSVKFNTEMKFDVQTNYNSLSFTKRSVGLNNFNIHLEQASKDEINKFKYFENIFLARVERKLVKKMPFLNKRYLVQNLNKTEYGKADFRNNCYYDGYWQSEDYFEPIINKLKKEFKSSFIPVLDDINNSHLNEIKNSKSVSIHIRRGDYISIKSNEAIFCTCSINYYEKAIKYINDKINNPLFFVFSDDIEWVKNNFKGEQFRIIANNSHSPELDLFLMSNCKHNIIANSSFSWWGAWLNQNRNKIVISPSFWLKNSHCDSITPKDWIKI